MQKRLMIGVLVLLLIYKSIVLVTNWQAKKWIEFGKANSEQLPC